MTSRREVLTAGCLGARVCCSGFGFESGLVWVFASTVCCGFVEY